MTNRRSLSIRSKGLWVAVAVSWLGLAWLLLGPAPAFADAGPHEAHDAHDAAGHGSQADQAPPAAHDHHAAGAHEEPVDPSKIIVRGGITREEERAYSLFMHRSCGLAVLALGLLVLADRLTQRRYPLLRKGMGVIWFLMGLHILFNADPTDWPLDATFMESYNRPGSGEWLQHKLLSLVPMAVGLYTMLVAPKLKASPYAGYAMGAVLAVAGVALLFHEHQHSPGMDMALIVKQHNVMALTALLIAAGWLADAMERLAWKPKLYVVPVGLILLGLELAVYTE
ncbi:MAG: hypothetical protein AB1411_10085 [Nitrospirota bacterium]